MLTLWRDIRMSVDIVARSICGAISISLALLLVTIISVLLYGLVLAPQQFSLDVHSLALMDFTSGADGSFSLRITADVLTFLGYVTSTVALLWYTVELIRLQRRGLVRVP